MPHSTRAHELHWRARKGFVRDLSGAAKESSKATAMINARSETASIKPAFCDALKFRRCLIRHPRDFLPSRNAGFVYFTVPTASIGLVYFSSSD
jgi:putative SOS response-associated peptidase YedK